ncbi:MAG: ATP-binding cassette domain-containing protein [Candidatus Rokubacteria bacterium]|nr:ATP-binding cassette domain-containing protein [Candidatus Rokubacteria bacterium]
MTALEVRDLHVRLAGIVILRGVSLDVPEGGVVGLVGRNGAGKTTTLKAIVGLIPVASGAIRLDGRDLGRLAPHERPALGLGYLPEDRRLIGSLTVEENLLLPAWATRRRESGEHLAFLYGLMPELTALGGRRAASLSGGQQKLVALARATMNSRRLLLLDEPLEGLSPALARRLAEVVRGLPGVAVLVTESDANRMRMLTDRIYTIERGEIVRDA